MKRLPKIFTLEELEKLNTKRLLSYLKQLHQCEESFEMSDSEINTDISETHFIKYKQTEKWKAAYKKVKSILKNREHLKKIMLTIHDAYIITRIVTLIKSIPLSIE